VTDYGNKVRSIAVEIQYRRHDEFAKILRYAVRVFWRGGCKG